MKKSVILSLLIIFIVYLVSRFPVSQIDLVSPLSKTDRLSWQQKLKDDKVFNENRDKVAAEEISWAKGEGKQHPLVVAHSYVVVNKDGEVVYSRNPDKPRSPASLTKLMTAMVVLDFSSLDEKFTVSSEAVDLEPTILMVDEGEKLSVNQLLEAIFLTSANDAAEVLAYGVSLKLGGSRGVFIRLMNEKAKNLGLLSTSFANPTGYDEQGQYSTARDLAKLARYAVENYPVIKKMVATSSSSIPESSEHKRYELPNWNALLGIYPGVNGIKIGYTGDAGYVTVVNSKQKEEEFLVVLLGAPDRTARDIWAAELLNKAFSDVGIDSFALTRLMLREKTREWAGQLSSGAIE